MEGQIYYTSLLAVGIIYESQKERLLTEGISRQCMMNDQINVGAATGICHQNKKVSQHGKVTATLPF